MSTNKIKINLGNNGIENKPENEAEPDVEEEEEEDEVEDEEEEKNETDEDEEDENSVDETDATEDDEDSIDSSTDSNDEDDEDEIEDEDTKNEPSEIFKIEKKSKKPFKKSVNTNKKSKKHADDNIDEMIDDINIDDNQEDEDVEEYENDYLQKFDNSIRKNIIEQFHPEMIIKNNAEIETLSRVVRNSNGNIIDPFHKTLPFLTKYEKARILGERANQINEGSPIFVNVDNDLIDGYLIALKEFDERKIPFIIQRPLPNGRCEYWRLQDLEII